MLSLMSDEIYNMGDLDTANNQISSDLISFNDEQLQEHLTEDKADNVAYTVGQTSRFRFDSESISASLEDEEDDDDPFCAPDDVMEIPKEFKPRVRRVSDVIDSIGEYAQDTNASRLYLTPEKMVDGSVSPVSSGYNSVSGTPKFAISPDWNINLPSPRKMPLRRNDVTDAGVSQSDASPMGQDGDMSPAPNVALEAAMPVHKDAAEYNMAHRRRGKAVIFNHDKFLHDYACPRLGSEVDVQALEKIYTALGFEVKVYHNLEYCEIKTAINSLAQEDHSDADCVMVTVLTHGMKSNYLYSKDVPYNLDMLWTPFTADNCLTLAGKPKLFVIQACRGDKLDPGVTLQERRSSRTETDSGVSAYKIPTHADFLIAYSGVEGFYSWRNPDSGTWFIQCLCKELEENAKEMDFLKIMTRTARRVALDHESFNDIIPWQHQQKQVPSFNSMLIRDLYFRPKV